MSDIEDVETLRAKTEAVKRRWPFYGEMVDWLVDLLTETLKADSRVHLPEVKIDSASVNSDLSKGKSLFQPETVPVDVELTGELCHALAKKTEGYRPTAADGFERVLSGLSHDLSGLIRAALMPHSRSLKRVCADYDVDPEAVKLILRLALRPSFRQLARTLRTEVDLSQWSYGHCPVCGSSPVLGSLAGEGESRMLYCSLCETSWAYPRIKCPFCENNNAEELSYLYAEEEEGLRVDVCHHCDQRLRTIDRRRLAGPVIPILDDLVTSHLAMATKSH